MSRGLRISARALVLSIVTASAEASAQDVSAHDASARLEQLAGLSHEARLEAQNAALPELVEDVETLRANLTDASASAMTRSLAAWALAEAGAVGCAELAEPGPLERTQDERVALAAALGRCGEFEALRELLDHEVVAVRFKAAVLLGLLGDADAEAALVELASEPDHRAYASYAALSLALLGHESALEAVRPLLNDVDFRPYVAIALGRAGDSSVLFDLRFAVESDDPIVRHSAMRVLMQGEFPGAEELCESAQNDVSPRIANDAALCGLDGD